MNTLSAFRPTDFTGTFDDAAFCCLDEELLDFPTFFEFSENIVSNIEEENRKILREMTSGKLSPIAYDLADDTVQINKNKIWTIIKRYREYT